MSLLNYNNLEKIIDIKFQQMLIIKLEELDSYAKYEDFFQQKINQNYHFRKQFLFHNFHLHDNVNDNNIFNNISNFLVVQQIYFSNNRFNFKHQIVLNSKTANPNLLFKEAKKSIRQSQTAIKDLQTILKLNKHKLSQTSFPMNSQYFFVYNNFDLVQKNLHNKIINLFSQQIVNKPMTYQQILLYLDEQCERFSKNVSSNEQYQQIASKKSRLNSAYQQKSEFLTKDQFKKIYYRADRNATKQIFDACKKAQTQKSSIKDFIWKYIQLLQTSKLCLIREQAKTQILNHRIIQAKKNVRQKTYVYIKMIQASIHSRYSDNPCFQYKIYPSSIPTITVVNSLNPILNHEYTLEMNQKQFYVYFYQSGVEIYKWKFSTKNFSNDGEYYQSIAVEPVTFQIHIKMLPEKTSEQLTQLNRQTQLVQKRLELSRKAFQNLCYYMPFLQIKPKSEEQQDAQDKSIFWKFTVSLFSFLPFLRRHVQVLHFILIALIFVECLAAVSWAVQFIDLIIIFGLLGALYDRSKPNVSMYLWAGMFGLFLSTIKTIWGALLTPFGMPRYPLILFIAIVFKVIALFFIWICTIRSEQIASHRIKDIYHQQFKTQALHKEEYKPIFKANQNYYKNKNKMVEYQIKSS